MTDTEMNVIKMMLNTDTNRVYKNTVAYSQHRTLGDKTLKKYITIIDEDNTPHSICYEVIKS